MTRHSIPGEIIINLSIVLKKPQTFVRLNIRYFLYPQKYRTVRAGTKSVYSMKKNRINLTTWQFYRGLLLISNSSFLTEKKTFQIRVSIQTQLAQNIFRSKSNKSEGLTKLQSLPSFGGVVSPEPSVSSSRR